ncbi:hypothetical protein [Streptococcus loxodontisalivarius]|uniref:MORN repeat protein n=1 Tax=Streptococcus loxodontisalivarius TaxID=1349415 RepID=A0ABS2PV79_9STRE|nr:hypothetical protein [Streptococcus loxodontisalivarius]MBM7643192.1 hypothetical protein [Streptococcus loxodontisalivarius]
MKKKRNRQGKISRGQWELLAVIVIFVFGLTVFTIPWSSQGTLTYDSGKISYQGQVVNNRMNGQGTLTFKNGDVYEGNFVNGVFDGQGTFTAKAGWSYTGGFKDGQADGQGTLTTASGKTYKGTFKQGIYQK